MGKLWTGSPTPTGILAEALRSDYGDEPWQRLEGFFRDGPIACEGIAERVGWLWPMGGLILGDPADASGDTNNFLEQDYWEADISYTGSGDFMYAISGFVKDADGNGVGNAWVGLYRSSDNQLVRSSYSVDSSGQYELRTDDAVTMYYVVARRIGPDIQGVTINTLVGS